MHPSEHLAQLLPTVAPYPEGVAPLPGRLGGTGFFPGGAGIWGAVSGKPLPELQTPTVMVLGHNLDSVVEYSRSLGNDQENMNGPTWRQLVPFLEEVGIGLEQCFFTNFYMGLIAEGSSTQRFPGASDDSFVERCRAFFVEQVQAIRPRTILVLGKEVPSCIAPLSPLLSGWASVKTFREIDSTDVAVIRGVEIAGISDISMVLLTHPCYRHLNAKYRRYSLATGHEAEVAMVRDAMEGISE